MTRNLLVRSLFVLAAGLLLAACSSKDTSDPPKPLSKLTVETVKFDRLWAKQIGDGVPRRHMRLLPAVDDKKVFAADHFGTVMAMSKKSGWVKWKTDLGGRISSGPVVFADRLFFGMHDGEVVAVDSSNGKVVWQESVSTEVHAPVVTDGNVVIAKTIDSRVYALDYESGARKWVYEESIPTLTLRGTSRPAIVGNLVIGGFDNGRVVAVDIATGKSIWNVHLAFPRGRTDLERLVDVDADIIVSGQDVFAAAYNGRIAKLAAESGQVLWSREVSSYSGLAYDDAAIYLVGDHSRIYAIDKQSGDTVWMQDALYQRQLTQPTLIDKEIVVGDFEGFVHAIDVSTGEVVGRESIDRRGIHAPLIKSGKRVFALGRGGILAAVELQSSSQQ